MQIRWDTKYEIGHERIDFEHRIFLGLLTQLSDEIDNGENQEKLVRTANEIAKYADFHFTSEENIMLDCGYPDYPAHSKEHKRLLIVFQDKVRDFIKGAVNADEVLAFIFEWFALHTTQIDKQIATYLLERNSQIG
jgi:hemerythrin